MPQNTRNLLNFTEILVVNTCKYSYFTGVLKSVSDYSNSIYPGILSRGH